MFRKNLVVHHQEHSIIYCVTQFGTIGTVVRASLDSPDSTNVPMLYTVYEMMLLMMDW